MAKALTARGGPAGDVGDLWEAGLISFLYGFNGSAPTSGSGALLEDLYPCSCNVLFWSRTGTRISNVDVLSKSGPRREAARPLRALGGERDDDVFAFGDAVAGRGGDAAGFRASDGDAPGRFSGGTGPGGEAARTAA